APWRWQLRFARMAPCSVWASRATSCGTQVRRLSQPQFQRTADSRSSLCGATGLAAQEARPWCRLCE
ncbi:unnamed protein product, partial [Symbiodinium microadriaticum]